MRTLTGLLLILLLAPAVEAQPKKTKDGKHGLGRKTPSVEMVKARCEYTKANHGAKLAALHKYPPPKATAPSYDCTAIGQDTMVQDQGQCGDCYWFSGTEVVADAQLVAGLVNLKATPAFQISVQWGLDYHPEMGGCDGGDEWAVAQLYLAPAKGGPALSGYPGAGQAPGPQQAITGPLYTISGMGYCDPNQQAGGVADIQLIKNCLVQYGPISVAVAASSWGDPGASVITGNDTNVDHASVIVGWDDAKGSKGAWKLKNSWSTQWGMGGYVYIEYGADAVGTEAFLVVASTGPPPPPPPPPGGVTITLTADQVASILAQSGGTISGDMTLNELVALLKKQQDAKKPPAKTLPDPLHKEVEALKAQIDLRLQQLQRESDDLAAKLKALKKQ